ncbi:MAG: hypothetical protein JEZ11_05860 [Desulfobacterales bacterium]|nr:hypothetical protein [Desulfobacterales bacterium]
MTTVIVENEACGFRTQITVVRKDRYSVAIVIESDCEAVVRWGKAIGEIDWRACLGDQPLTSRLWQTAIEILPHRSCPVLIGTLRAVETAVGLARPAGVRIRFISPETPP